MGVTGGIKFFDINLADSQRFETEAGATSGADSAPFVLDRNYYTVWRSVGSDDLTTETLTITIPIGQNRNFNRIFLLNHNWKEYNVQYFDTIGYVDFTNVISVNGDTKSAISETDYARNSSYYEFDTVNTSTIFPGVGFLLRIQVTKTQTANQEKFLNSVVMADELGTLLGFPIISQVTKDKNNRENKLLNGRVDVEKSLEVFNPIQIDFKNYPPGLNEDLDLIYSLFDRDVPFYVSLCGGRAGDPYFKYALRGFRLEDLPLVQVTNKYKDKYRKNLYNSMVDLKMILKEAG